MKYMGSKNRIAKEVLQIILKDRKPDQWYVEPFVGGANMLDKVSGVRLGADENLYTIEALKLIRDSPESLPLLISESDYYALKAAKKPEGLAGVVGFGCSFGSRFFEGYARGGTRNYMRETRDNAIKQSPLLKGALFFCCSYLFLDIPPNSIIYCDPPYKGAKGYKAHFDHDIFWQWVRLKTLEGHTVFVSEYSAPPDFECIWQKKLITSFSTSENLEATEKLFIFNDLY